MDTKAPFLYSSSTEESVLLTANPFFLPPLPTWFPTTTKHHPECATPKPQEEFRTPACPTANPYCGAPCSPLKLGWGLQPSVLLPVDPAGSTEAALHVGWAPGIPLGGLSGCRSVDKRVSPKYEALGFSDQSRAHPHPHASPCPELTVAALASQALLESSPIHARFGTHRDDLVRIWLSAM